MGIYITSAAMSAAGIVVFQLAITEDSTNVDRMWANGVLQISGNSGGNNLTGLMLFAYPDGSYSSNSKIAEVGIVKTATGYISAADQANLEAYCEDRYGVAIVYWDDGSRTTILCMNDMNMTDEMMMFLTVYNSMFYQGRSEW